MSDVFDKAARAAGAAVRAGPDAAAWPDKNVLIARIRARRGQLAQAAAGTLPPAPVPRAAAAGPLPPGGADATVTEDGGLPVEARLLPRDPAAVAYHGREFPRSGTLRLLLQHPLAFALGVGLVWKLGPARLLLAGRLILPLLRQK